MVTQTGCYYDKKIIARHVLELNDEGKINTGQREGARFTP